MLKPLFRASLVFVLLALVCATALAQPAQPGQPAPPATPDRYIVVSYIKILPGQQDAYRSHLATISKPFYQEMLRANPDFLSWSVAQVMYPGLEHGLDFDYVASAVFSGPPPEPGVSYDAIAMKAAGMSQADLGRKLALMRTVVGSEILRRRAGINAPVPLKEGDVRIMARTRIKPGMGDEYYEWAQSLMQPVMEARAAAGELKSWSVWSRVFPSGAATSYDALVVTYFKEMASAIKGLDAAKGVEAFLKVHPGQNYAAYVNNARDYSELQQRFVVQVVGRVAR